MKGYKHVLQGHRWAKKLFRNSSGIFLEFFRKNSEISLFWKSYNPNSRCTSLSYCGHWCRICWVQNNLWFPSNQSAGGKIILESNLNSFFEIWISAKEIIHSIKMIWRAVTFSCSIQVAGILKWKSWTNTWPRWPWLVSPVVLYRQLF